MTDDELQDRLNDPEMRLPLAILRVCRMSHTEFLDAADKIGLSIHNTSST